MRRACAVVAARVACSLLSIARGLTTPPTPPRLPTPPSIGKYKLPPPPPLPAKSVGQPAGWKSPSEILNIFVEFVPTFYVPVNCVAAILNEEARSALLGRQKFSFFLKKYRFFFEVRQMDGGRMEVKLREDVSHPKKGIADEKFELTDIGTVATYTCRTEFVTSLDSLERSDGVVYVKPQEPPPSIQVRLEERVPVLERLKEMVPHEYAQIEELEETIPEDVLFHPYFDCQGGLASIASKFPEYFQVVEGTIRRRPPHIAPMAINDFNFENSPDPDIIKKVKKLVCVSDVPQWVGITPIYELLSPKEKRRIKNSFRSFAGFLRAHGSCLAVSTDTLSVATWIPPANQDGESAKKPEAKTKIITPMHVINELYDKFPRNKDLCVTEVLKLVPAEMKGAVPNNVVGWLDSYRGYFYVNNPEETDLDKVIVRRTSDHVPLDIARGLYEFIPDKGIEVTQLKGLVTQQLHDTVARLGLVNLVNILGDWLALKHGILHRLRSMDDLEKAIHSAAQSRKKKKKIDLDEEIAGNVESVEPHQNF